ncbi:MAG TPA: trigger factor [Acidobacterium sp.]|nr:trigger factor [Acidobacterium sp.]
MERAAACGCCRCSLRRRDDRFPAGGTHLEDRRHTLTATETIDNTPNPETATETAAHEGHEHAHGDEHTHEHQHSHEHQHGPTLNPECTRDVEVEIPADEVSKAFRSVLKKIQKQARIPGFRAGKVPETILRNRFQDTIQQEVVETVLPHHFRAAIDAKGLQPISQPQVTELHLKDGDPLRFKAVFEVMPEFSVDGYQDIKVEKADAALTDAEFDEELKRIIDSRSTMEPVTEDRALADGDFAQITFQGQIAGEEAEGENADQPIEGQDVMVEVGGTNTLPAFSESLRGAKPGQELKFEVAYPAEFGEQRLAGKTVAYDVTVNGIKTRVQPELNDEFAKELGEYESFDDFKQKLREHMTEEKARRVESETRNKLIDAYVERFQFPVPESLVQSQIDARLDRGLRALAAQGMRTEDMRKLDFARLREGQHAGAQAEVKGTLILDKIADAEKVEVSEEELDKELFMLSVQMQEPVDVLRSRLTSEGNLARIREQIRREKTGKMLVEKLG